MFGAGGWKFYEILKRRKRQSRKEKRSQDNIFRDDLMVRVNKLEAYKDECMTSLLAINKEVATLTTKLEFLEKENNTLKIKLQR